jgi:hypothetical protein
MRSKTPSHPRMKKIRCHLCGFPSGRSVASRVTSKSTISKYIAISVVDRIRPKRYIPTMSRCIKYHSGGDWIYLPPSGMVKQLFSAISNIAAAESTMSDVLSEKEAVVVARFSLE